MNQSDAPGTEESASGIVFDENEEFDIGAIKKQFGFDEDGIHISEKVEASYIPSTILQQQKSSAVGSTSTIEATTTAASATAPSTALDMRYGEAYPLLKRMKTPRTFMSGSTPLQHNQRYLMWNSAGVIRSFKSEDESTVEIRFHDATLHPEIILDNAGHNFSMADLNTTIVALASRSNAKKERFGHGREKSQLSQPLTELSELMVRHIEAWDFDSREWTLTMPNAERVECLSVGASFIAVLTNANFLRIFSATGIQRAVVSTTGSIATMSAAAETLVLARYTGGVVITPDEEYQPQVSADVYTVRPLSNSYPVKLAKSLPLCLGPDCRLEWMSLTGCGRLVTMDSDCMLRLYSTSADSWLPILAGEELLKEPLDDFIWPIFVQERPTPLLRYVYCRGSRYPSVNRNPLATTVEWKLPVVGQESEKGKVEGEMLLQELLRSEYKDDPQLSSEMACLTQDYLANLIKLFAISCKSGKECRAAELAHLTPIPQGVQIMCNYAEKNQRPKLSEKVAEIGRNRISAAPAAIPQQHYAGVHEKENDNLLAPDRRVFIRRGGISKARNPNASEESRSDTGVEIVIDENPTNRSETATAMGNPFKKTKLLGDNRDELSRGEKRTEQTSGNFFDTYTSKNSAKKK